jgi:Zn-dependent protease
MAVIQYSGSWKYILMVATVWGPALLFVVLFHELGHIWMTRHFGGGCTYSMLWPLGGFGDCEIVGGSCIQEFWVALAGPLMHIPQFFLWLTIMALCAPGGVDYYGSTFDIDEFDAAGANIWFAQMAKRTLDANLMIFAINMLLPAYPMDVARMVAAMCVHCGLSVDTAAFVLVVVGVILGVVAVIYGIISLISGEGPGILMLLIGLFVLYTSWNLWKVIQSKTVLSHPIFKPDCYHRSTNLSNEAVGGGNPPASSRNSRNNRPPAKNPKDIEMGNAPPSSPKRGSRGPPSSPRKGGQAPPSSPKKGGQAPPSSPKKSPSGGQKPKAGKKGSSGKQPNSSNKGPPTKKPPGKKPSGTTANK